MTVLAACLAVAAAVCFALAASLQRYAAGQAPPTAIGWRLPTHLARRPVWVACVAAMITGSGLHLLALGHVPLMLVQPLGVSAVVFTLPIGAALHRRRVRPREWAAAVVVTVSLCGVLLLVPAHPGGVPTIIGVFELADVALAAAMVLGSIARACAGAARAPLYALAAGVAFGTVSALARIMLTAGSGGPAVAAAVAAVPLALLGFLLSQHGYRTGSVAVVPSTITVTDPLTNQPSQDTTPAGSAAGFAPGAVTYLKDLSTPEVTSS